MLQFIKGDNFAEYMQVIQDETVDISEALFLDTVKHRLYLNGDVVRHAKVAVGNYTVSENGK